MRVTDSACILQVSVVSGGITNMLLCLHHQLSGQRVMVRIFGDKTEMLIDRERELLILRQLNAAGFGANVVGTFANGRLEEYLWGHTLGPDDVRNPIAMPQIAHRLAEFHAVLVDEDDRSPQLWRNCDAWCAASSAWAFLLGLFCLMQPPTPIANPLLLLAVL